MLTFKMPLRVKPIVSEIAPDGRLLFAHWKNPHVIIYEQIGTEWKIHKRVIPVQEPSDVACSRSPFYTQYCLRQPIRAIVGHLWSSRHKTIEVGFGEQKCYLGMKDGFLTGYIESEEFMTGYHCVSFQATLFGMILIEAVRPDHSRVNVYTAEFDWNEFESVSNLKFKHFAYLANSDLGFHTDPNRCIYALTNGQPQYGQMEEETSVGIPPQSIYRTGLLVNKPISTYLTCDIDFTKLSSYRSFKVRKSYLESSLGQQASTVTLIGG